MSELQIILIVIGALIIAAVLIFNWWQERRFHQQVKNSFTHLQSDALLDDPKLDVGKLPYEVDDFADNDLANDNFSISLPEPTVATEDDFASGESDNSAEQPPEDADPEDPAVIDTAEAEPACDANEAAHQLDAEHQTTPEVLKESASSLPAMLHAQMDLTAVLYLATESTTESSAEKLNNALNGLFDDYEKPVYVHVLDSNKQWVLLKDASTRLQTLNQPISRFACSLQLADRAGAVSRSMLNRFKLAVETLGLDINAHVEWQSSGDALATANALDAFCIEVDKTMGFHLIHGDNGAFTGTKLKGLSEAHGLTLAADGTFKYFDEGDNKQALPQPPSFIMFNRDQHPFSAEMLRTSVVKAVTFQLDIPHVKHCAEAFNRMVQIARQMETGLNAVLVDDNNRVLSDIQIEKIRQQLKVIHATMLVRGIVPGADSALRLFS